MPNGVLANLKPIPKQGDMLLDDEATAKAIVNAREALNIQQKALAIEMGISTPFLCDLEKAHRRWSLALFEKAKAAMERLVK
jgi:predicted transcriptional regulator